MDELEKFDNVNEDLQKTENDSEIEDAATENFSENANENFKEENAVDYAAIIKADTDELKARFPELAKISDVSELDNPLRYAALRDLGLTPEEAYLATRKRRASDNRSHLYPSPSISKNEGGAIPESEMRSARELFAGMSDAEIRKLYRKVTK